MLHFKKIVLGVAAALAVAACSPDAATTSTTVTAAPTATSTTAEGSVTEPVETTAAGELGTVSGPISGNRVLSGSSSLVDQAPTDIELGGVPLWIVGAPGTSRPTWVVGLDDGTLEGWRLGTAGPERLSLNVDSLAVGTPPLVAVDGDEVTVVSPPEDASPLTYPVRVGDTLVYVRTDGTLVSGGVQLDIGALPDSRISVSSDGLVSVLAGATDRYPHGVLGDRLEASSIVVVDPLTAAVVGETVISEPDVIEGIGAPWVDIDGDGVEELLVTVSNGDVGARLSIYDRTGALVADGPPIGRANRWRNQLGAGPTGPDGEIEIIDVRVPHIGGVVEHFRVEGEELVRHAEQTGFTSHVFGSRNLDMALAADVTGDGRLDVLAPSQDLTTLGVLSRNADGVGVVAELSLPGQLTSNVSGVSLDDGSVAIAVGTSEATLRVYIAG